MAIENFGWRFTPYRDSQGNLTLKQKTNDQYVVLGNKVMLHEKINENKGISITNYVEIPLGNIPAYAQYAVDYDTNIITFNPSAEGKTIYASYYSEGN